MLDTKILAEINKIPGYEHKKAFSGAFATKPTGYMAAKPIKCVKPGTKKVYSLNDILDAVGRNDYIFSSLFAQR